MAAIRSLGSIAEKWARVTPERAPEYQRGVESPKADWATKSKEAAGTWKQAITEAANRGAYGKGIEAAGTEKWKRGAIQKGPGRFSEGVQLARDDYGKGFSKYRDIIERTTLPPRYPKGDLRNLERVKAITTALRTAKVGV